MRLDHRSIAWLGCVLGLVVILASPAAETPDQLPSNEVLRHYLALANPQLSPDGKHALLHVSEATADGGKSHVWLIDVEGGPPRQLTFSPEADKRGEHDATWLPDGTGVLFLARRGERTSLYELPMNGGEARMLDIKVRPKVDASKDANALPPPKAGEPAKDPDPLALDIGDYDVSPDGVWIAVLASDPQTPGEKQQQEAKADADWVDHDPHGTRLYLLKRATNEITSVALAVDVRAIEWKPDSSELLAVVEAPHHQSDLGPAGSAWRVAVAHPDQATALTGIPATVSSASWALDGQSILFTAEASTKVPPGYRDLFRLNLADSHVTELTAGLEGTLAQRPVSLAGPTVAVPLERGVDVTVGLYAPGASSAELLQLPVTAVASFRSNARRSGWLLLGSSGGHPSALYHASQINGDFKALKTPSITPEHVRSVAPKRIRWSHEGLAIDGLLYLPPAAERQAVPLIVEVHGGPTGAYSDNFEPWVDFLLGHGWAVLRTNPRGSTGRGAAFAAANKNDLGGGDYRDIMAGVDYVLKTERIDPERMALMGYSYGGEMAGFVEGSTTRFKAIVSGAPVIDQYSEYGTESGSWYDRWFYGEPWLHPQDAWRQSPLAKIGRARTPFLLLQGQTDSTDPLGQSQEMYRALRQAGVPVELVSYPRDDHGALARALYGAPSPEPWHGFDARRRVVEFIEKAFGKAGQPPGQSGSPGQP